jgi:YbbR domain-containing protein
MRTALKWIYGLITQNLGWKLLSLAIATLLWALVASEPELATFETVRLEYRNLADDIEISSDPVSTVTLELSGPSGELRGVGASVRPAVVLDMSGVQQGQRTFMIGDGNVRLARGVRLVRAIPSEIRLDFERRAVRAVKVVPRFSSAGSNGYSIAQYRVEPPDLRIAGPNSRVARVNAAVTDPVDVSSVVGTSEFRINAFVDDPYVRILSSPQVAVTVTMRKK